VVILPGITSSWTRNPPEDGDFCRYSAGNYQFIGADESLQDQNARKILRTVTISGSVTPNALCWNVNFFKTQFENLNEMKDKPDPALFGRQEHQ
jgi:hypothetical protein